MTDSPQQDEQQGNRGIKPVNAFYKEFAPFLTLGVQLAAAVIVFYFIGSWIDKRYDTAPAFTLVGIMLGTVGGLIKFFITVLDLSKKEKPPKATDDRES